MPKPQKAVTVLAINNPMDQDSYAELVNDTEVTVTGEQTFTTKEGDVLRAVDFERTERPTGKISPLPLPPVC
jgi:hypothetical protein